MASSTTRSEPLVVAIATENDDYDGDVYRALLEISLARPVERWNARDKRFSGWKSIARLADPFLRAAELDGVTHALFAIDNDGGSKRRPEHLSTHVPADEAAKE